MNITESDLDALQKQHESLRDAMIQMDRLCNEMGYVKDIIDELKQLKNKIDGITVSDWTDWVVSFNEEAYKKAMEKLSQIREEEQEALKIFFKHQAVFIDNRMSDMVRAIQEKIPSLSEEELNDVSDMIDMEIAKRL